MPCVGFMVTHVRAQPCKLVYFNGLRVYPVAGFFADPWAGHGQWALEQDLIQRHRFICPHYRLFRLLRVKSLQTK